MENQIKMSKEDLVERAQWAHNEARLNIERAEEISSFYNVMVSQFLKETVLCYLIAICAAMEDKGVCTFIGRSCTVKSLLQGMESAGLKGKVLNFSTLYYFADTLDAWENTPSENIRSGDIDVCLRFIDSLVTSTDVVVLDKTGVGGNSIIFANQFQFPTFNPGVNDTPTFNPGAVVLPTFNPGVHTTPESGEPAKKKVSSGEKPSIKAKKQGPKENVPVKKAGTSIPISVIGFGGRTLNGKA